MCKSLYELENGCQLKQAQALLCNILVVDLVSANLCCHESAFTFSTTALTLLWCGLADHCLNLFLHLSRPWRKHGYFPRISSVNCICVLQGLKAEKSKDVEWLHLFYGINCFFTGQMCAMLTGKEAKLWSDWVCQYQRCIGVWKKLVKLTWINRLLICK